MAKLTYMSACLQRWEVTKNKKFVNVLKSIFQVSIFSLRFHFSEFFTLTLDTLTQISVLSTPFSKQAQYLSLNAF